jgi:hypothetical protein
MRKEKLLAFVEDKLPRNLNTVKKAIEEYEKEEKTIQLNQYLDFLKKEYGEDAVKAQL